MKKGISLIVLVITILVMIILAAVVIITLSNQNIIGKAQEANSKYKQKTFEEQLASKYQELYLEKESQKSKITLEDIKGFEDDNTIYLSTNTNNNYVSFKIEDYEFNVYLSGKIEYVGTAEIIRTQYNSGENVKLNTIFGSKTVYYNGSVVTNINELDIAKYIVCESGNNIYLYSKKSNVLYDMSSNEYNATLENGANIKEDSEGNVYIKFDGINDYVSIPTLSSTIDFSSGFDIEYDVMWKATNDWSRIIELAKGILDSSILLANSNTSSNLVFSMRNGSNVISGNDSILGTITLNEKENRKISVDYNSNQYTYTSYKNNVQEGTEVIAGTLNNVERTANYIGKSTAYQDGYFKGKIYRLKIILENGTEVLNYCFNRCSSVPTIEILNQNGTQSKYIFKSYEESDIEYTMFSTYNPMYETEEYLDFACSWSGNRAGIYTDEKVDLTNAKEIIVDVDTKTDGGGLTSEVYVGICSEKSDQVNFVKYAMDSTMSTSFVNKKIALDLSEVTGEYYIKVMVYHPTDVGAYSANAKFYEIKINY